METREECVIDVADVHCEEALALIRAMLDEMAELYHDDGFTNLVPARMDNARSAFVLARRRGRAVGCGAMRPLEGDIGEVKRMYVVPELRGRRIAQRILERLEELARGFGYTALRLETGTLQPEAIRLYERCGYHRIPCYIEDADDDEMSVYMEKRLGNQA